MRPTPLLALAIAAAMLSLTTPAQAESALANATVGYQGTLADSAGCAGDVACLLDGDTATFNRYKWTTTVSNSPCETSTDRFVDINFESTKPVSHVRVRGYTSAGDTYCVYALAPTPVYLFAHGDTTTRERVWSAETPLDATGIRIQIGRVSSSGTPTITLHEVQADDHHVKRTGWTLDAFGETALHRLCDGSESNQPPAPASSNCLTEPGNASTIRVLDQTMSTGERVGCVTNRDTAVTVNLDQAYSLRAVSAKWRSEFAGDQTLMCLQTLSNGTWSAPKGMQFPADNAYRREAVLYDDIWAEAIRFYPGDPSSGTGGWVSVEIDELNITMAPRAPAAPAPTPSGTIQDCSQHEAGSYSKDECRVWSSFFGPAVQFFPVFLLVALLGFLLPQLSRR